MHFLWKSTLKSAHFFIVHKYNFLIYPVQTKKDTYSNTVQSIEHEINVVAENRK
jgi:hypothetical protein